MHISDISLIGWIHTAACIAALVFGGWNIVAVKGSPSHKFRGRGYVATMVVAMVLSFGIYRRDFSFFRGANSTVGIFGFLHWLSVAALLLTVLGYCAASRQQRGFWAYTHPVAMTISYYLLVGGPYQRAVRPDERSSPLCVHYRQRPARLRHDPRCADDALHKRTRRTCSPDFFVVKVWRYRRLQRTLHS